MAKAAENLTTLESSLLKLTEPGGCTVEALLTFVYGVFYGMFVKKPFTEEIPLFLLSSVMNQPKQ